MGDDEIQVCPTAVRVPVAIGHSESILVETEKPLTVVEAKRLFEEAPGVTVIDDLDNHQYPMPRDCDGKDDVFVGRIRRDISGGKRHCVLVRQRQLAERRCNQCRADRRADGAA